MHFIKSPKRTLLLLLTATAFGLISFQMANPAPPPGSDPPYDQSSFERFPPVPIDYWVQKLPTPMPDGSNIIMQIKYIADFKLPPVIAVYLNDGSIDFHDDGIGPDAVAGDSIYTAYIKENIPSFLSQITAMQAHLEAKGSFTTFQGHIGHINTETPFFDVNDFNNFHRVELDRRLINGVDCSSDLLPQNSLFITDLSVVEDPARTYNVAVDTGNPVGVWTFGSMIRNIVNDPTPGAAKAFLKSWVKSYYTGRMINGDSIQARTSVVTYLIGPWLKKANGLATCPTANFWEAVWDTTNEASLLQNAPFKLLAIVNRFDLVGNSAYASNVSLAGETRFIYTLIAPVDYPAGAGGNSVEIHKGTVPIQSQNNKFDDLSLIDWKGMNVILEYGNVQTNNCDMQSFAQSWLNLSSDTLGTSTFNDDLEAITNTVTAAGAAPLKVNGSALDRIRSNERIFYPSIAAPSSQVATDSWSQSDWQLSQFELDSITHQLKPVPVTNTPQLNSSNQTNITSIAANRFGMNPSSSAALINWVFAHAIEVAQGNHLLPNSYVVNGDTLLLAGTADVTNEQGHYWDLNWDATGMPNYTVIPAGIPATYADSQKYAIARLLRNQLSLNTCQGCHSGENKTLFTQIRPVGYGVSENYWSIVPESETGHVDLRFVQNTGKSTANGNAAWVYNLISPTTTFPSPDYTNTTTTITVPDVSAFLTGRAYHGGSDFSDDYSGDDATDAGIQGYYCVFDPIDNNDGTTNNTRPSPDQINRYNDLQRRQSFLCAFVNINCGNGSTVLGTVRATSTIPMSE